MPAAKGMLGLIDFSCSLSCSFCKARAWQNGIKWGGEGTEEGRGGERSAHAVACFLLLCCSPVLCREATPDSQHSLNTVSTQTTQTTDRNKLPSPSCQTRQTANRNPSQKKDVRKPVRRSQKGFSLRREGDRGGRCVRRVCMRVVTETLQEHATAAVSSTHRNNSRHTSTANLETILWLKPSFCFGSAVV